MKEKICGLVKSKWLLAIIINIAILALCILITSFSYDNADDFYNSLYICKYHYYYNNDINFILSTLIGSMQYVLNGFNCFVLSQILMSCFAFASFSYVLIDKFGKTKGIAFTLMINVLFALNHYADMSSNKTAALLLAAGFILVHNSIRNKRYNYPCWVGIIEILFGSFFNYQYFFVAFGFALAFFIAELFAKKKYKTNFRRFHWFFRPYLILFVLIAALAFGTNLYSKSVNTSNATASDYYEYSCLTDSINNLPFPDYKTHKDEFVSAGVDENDYELLKSGYYDINTSLNLNSLKLVSQIQDSENSKNIFSGFSDIGFDMLTHFSTFDAYAYTITIFVLLTVAYIFIQKKHYFLFPTLYAVAAVVSGLCMRYFYSGSASLIYGIWLMLFMFLIFSFNFEEFNKIKLISHVKTQKRRVIASSILILCLLSGYGTVYATHYQTLQLNNKPSDLYAEIDRHPERYYVLDPSTSFDYLKYTDNFTHPLWGFREDFLENIDGFSYFHNNQEIYKHNLPDNIYKAVLGNKNIYVVDNYITFRKEKYLKKYYAQHDLSVSYMQINEINGFKIYDVVVK